MIVCLEHVDVLLDAGYQPVMQMGEWSWGEMQYDPGNALQLTVKEILWALDGFFAESGSNSEDGPRNVSPGSRQNDRQDGSVEVTIEGSLPGTARELFPVPAGIRIIE